MQYVLCLRSFMVLTKCFFRRENLMASLLFCIVSYGLLSTWLYLVHSINEKVESTLPSSLLIRVLIIITALSFIIQKKPDCNNIRSGFSVYTHHHCITSAFEYFSRYLWFCFLLWIFFNGFLLRTTFMFMYKNGLILCNVNMIHNLRSEYTYPP